MVLHCMIWYLILSQLPRSGRRVEVCAATSAATGGGYSPSPMAFAAVRFGIFLVLGHCLVPLIFLLLRARLCLANVEVTASAQLRCGIGETFILFQLCSRPEKCGRQLRDHARMCWWVGGLWTSLGALRNNHDYPSLPCGIHNTWDQDVGCVRKELCFDVLMSAHAPRRSWQATTPDFPSDYALHNKPCQL